LRVFADTFRESPLMRPKIGFALGAGAARGLTEIGVLDGLAALRVVPDIVVGTSMGALVGAAFVTGRLPELKARLEAFRRRDVAAMLDVHLTSGGLIAGSRIENFLGSLGISGTIETLPIRFAAVATDFASGREVWLREGPIGRAVRASIGIPGVFSPARYEEGDGWLLDGGLVNPVPVSLARALGADIVIAVEVTSTLYGGRSTADDASASANIPAVPADAPRWLKDAVGPMLQRVLQPTATYPSYFEVLANTLNIMQERIARARLAGDPPDVLLRPNVSGFTWLDFHRAREAVAEGVTCVQASASIIRRACRDAIPRT
jgi:NTE family protein